MKIRAIWYLFTRKNSKVNTMRTVLVDDHAILLDGVKSLLDKEENIQIIGQFNSAEKALEFLKINDADLVITDFSMPGMDGLTMIHTLKRILPEIKVIILSMHDEIHLVKEILKSGVNGFVLKKDTNKELLDAVEDVREGKVFLSHDINKLLIANLHNPDENRLLTDREREILKLIAKEFSNKQIAETLFISERTVETHRKNIFRKTNTNSIVGLIKFAYANNLI
jgi:DNA-binding NarL/FixJ family response regulator